MRAMVLHKISQIAENTAPLELEEWPDPVPQAGQLLIRVATCGVCHTELDEIEGRTPPPQLPIIPGHQIIGRVAALGVGVSGFSINQRVGVAWIFSACGNCAFCLGGNENLCSQFQATGKDANGGYAELVTLPAAFAIPIPEIFSDEQAAPLLCAGAIGYRSLQLAGLHNRQPIGLTGFGASAHLVLQMIRHLFPESKIYVFARNQDERDFALKLGATWAGDSTDTAPEKLHTIIDTTPAWAPIVSALANLEPGGRLVINAIRKEARDKEALLTLDYSQHLWMEKEIKSVANITRADVREFLALAAAIPLNPEIQLYPMEEANRALIDLKTKAVKGAKVLCIQP